MPAKINVQHAARLAAHLSIQREHGKYCDVCVCVGDKRFLAHKCVLSANSSKLDALILDAIGHNSTSQDIEIEIQGVSPVGFETLLEHFYIGELNLTTATVMSVWMTAAYLELHNITEMCSSYCQRSVVCVSNQPNSEKTAKISEEGSNIVMTTITPTLSRSSSETNTESQDEVSKYSQMRTVTTAPLKEDGGGKTTEENNDKEITSNNNTTVSWASTCDDFQSNACQAAQQFQSESTANSWSRTNQVLSAPTNQTTSNETCTVASTGQVVKEEDILEDGEIPVHSSNSRLIQQAFIHTVASTAPPSASSISVIDVNKLVDDKCVARPECEDMMLEVERLRMQHQHLQRLQQQQASLGNVAAAPVATHLQPHPTFTQPNLSSPEPAKKKAKKKKLPPIIHEDGIADSSVSHALVPLFHTSPSQVRENPHSRPPASSNEFKIITDEYRESLYERYPVKQESPMSATCTAEELLQRGKSRKRKSTEQNALNNTIRLVLDTLEVTESNDPIVEDALILIMDRFESLRGSMNDPVVRRSLLVKVRHSIHCKKWRVKKQMMKKQMSELGMTSADEFSSVEKEVANEDSLHG